MSDQETVNKLLQIVHNLEVVGDTQIEVDNMYKEFSVLLMDQMEDNLREIPYNNQSTGFRKRKPWWSAELAELWRSVRNAERCWLKARNSADCRRLREKFCAVRKQFDKKVQCAKR